MPTATVSRDASATVRGYLYQFDATILGALAMAAGDSITVEGIEDFDVLGSDLSTFFQCKYYEAASLTPSTLRDAILPMLESFLKKDPKTRSASRYNLYGYFRASTPENRHPTMPELKAALQKRRQVTVAGVPSWETVDLQKELGAKDEDLTAFIAQLTIHISEEYLRHQAKVINALRDTLAVTQLEAENSLYPTARTVISSLASLRTAKDRTITRAEFLERLTPSRALYNAWSLRELEEREYCSKIKTAHFAHRNIDPTARFFLIDPGPAARDVDLVNICETIASKWSSHRTVRKPDKERYAPYIFFRDLDASRVAEIKRQTSAAGVRLVDGYPFLGAAFNSRDLQVSQTYENQVALRFISSRLDLESSGSSPDRVGSVEA